LSAADIKNSSLTDKSKKLTVTANLTTESGKNYKSIHEDFKQKETMKQGSLIRIVAGRHKDLDAKVVAINEADLSADSMITAELVKSDA